MRRPDGGVVASLRALRAFTSACALAVAAMGCRPVLVATYSKESEDAVLNVYAKVEELYDVLGDSTISAERRSYAQVAGKYSEISGAVKALALREEGREKNEKSIRAVRELQDQIVKNREDHRKRDVVPIALVELNRADLKREFAAVLAAERAKKDTP